MSTFHEHLRKCRLSGKITQKELANYLKVSERAYQHYEAGSREPSYDKLIALADYFDISADYLLGRTENPKSHKL